MSGQGKKRGTISSVCSAIGTILLIAIIVLYIPMTIPKFAGYEMFTVVSGSMEPEIPTGSLVYVKEADSYEVGDVIAFYGTDVMEGTVVTHRIIDIDQTEEVFHTKGDANEAVDMRPVPFYNVIGTVRRSIPKLGWLAQVFSTGAGKIFAICFVGAAVIFFIIAAFTDNRK